MQRQREQETGRRRQNVGELRRIPPLGSISIVSEVQKIQPDEVQIKRFRAFLERGTMSEKRSDHSWKRTDTTSIGAVRVQHPPRAMGSSR
ncbi:unnamed protein product [Arctogadus glacialis]